MMNDIPRYEGLISDWEDWLEKRHREEAHDTAPGLSRSDAGYLGLDANRLQKEMLGFCREIDVHSNELLFRIKEHLEKMKALLLKKKG